MRTSKPTAISMHFAAVFLRIVFSEDFSSVPPPSSPDEWEDLRSTASASYYGEDSAVVKEEERSVRTRSSPQRKTTVIGGSRILECPIAYPQGVYADHIITWRKRDVDVPIFIQFNGYPPHVDAGFQDRIRLVEQASIEISDIRRKDQGWYECSVAFLGAAGAELEAESNGTWIHLTVHSLPKLSNVSPSSILLRDEAPLNLVCEASGNPFPTVTWSKDGKTVTPSERIQIAESSLSIHSTRGTDGGVYVCIVRNTVGHVSHTARVIVAGNVYIIVPPSNTTVFDGSDARFACKADGYPTNISYRWYRGDVPLSSLDVLYQQRFTVFPNGTLVLKDVTKDDGGWYCCRPTNGFGIRPNASAFLNVTFLPRVSEMPVQLSVARGLPARIVCPIEANPPITLVVWSKNERMIDVTKSTTLRVNKQGTLFISTVESSDEGRYSCTPYSPIGAGRSSAPVQVIVKEPPYFTVRPKSLYQREVGESLTMPCIAHGNPIPTVAWHKVEGELPEERVHLDDDGNLTVTDLSEEDEGLFECVATSVIGSVVATVLLIMEVRGFHCAYNVSVATTMSSATVSWLPAYNEGRRHQYVLWYRDLTSDQDDWMTLQVIPEDRYCITVYHLNPGSMYQFMVLARSHLTDDELFSEVVNGTTKGEPLSNREEGTTSLLANNLIIASNEDEHLLPTAGTSILPPTNVTASKLRNGSLLISWKAPDDLRQTVDYYSIQYRTNGRQWTALSDKIRNSSSFVWTSGPRGMSYHFQVLSHSNGGASSRPSRMASVQTEVRSNFPVYISVSNVLLGVIVGSISFLLLGTVLIVASSYFVRAKKKPALDAQYSNLKYYNPNAANKSSSSQDSGSLCPRTKDAGSAKDPDALLKTKSSKELNCSEVRGHHETPI